MQKQSSTPQRHTTTHNSIDASASDSGFSSEVSRKDKSAREEKNTAVPSSPDSSKKRRISLDGERSKDAKQPEEPRPSASISKSVAKVEYHDVSAEVEARLAAKQRKKKEKETSKKRKRPSLDSNADGHEINSTKVDTERPKSKKAKIIESMKMPPANPRPSARRSARSTTAPRSKPAVTGVAPVLAEVSADGTAPPSNEPIDVTKAVKRGRRHGKHRRSGGGSGQDDAPVTGTPSKKVKLG